MYNNLALVKCILQLFIVDVAVRSELVPMLIEQVLPHSY